MIEISSIVLLNGAHNSRQDGTCFMEAVAWIADEAHSDHPDCVCPVLGSFLRRWNDDLPNEDRQLLKPYLRLVIGTGGDGHQKQRAWMTLDWLIREHAPAFLELAPALQSHAQALRNLPLLNNDEALQDATPTINAAGDAAGDAAGAAARDAARAAAWAAAWAAAGDAAWAAARDAARAAAWAAAWDAAGAAARAAAWDAAGAAAGAALETTIENLQSSAFALLDRMLLLDIEQREITVLNEPELVSTR